MAPTPEYLRKEMGISHKDFFRLLPGLFTHLPRTVDGRRVLITDGNKQVEILLSEEQVRSLSPIVNIPYTFVELTFSGFAPHERQDFLEGFDRHYFKGGG